MVKKKGPMPAQQKYDKAHPVVSLRVDPELKQKLDKIKEKSGAGIAGILRNAVSTQGQKYKSTYALGHDNGYVEARKKYQVIFKCSKCGGNVSLEDEYAKKDVAEYLTEKGFKHPGCKPAPKSSTQ